MMIHNRIRQDGDQWLIWTSADGSDKEDVWDDPLAYWDRVRFWDKLQYLNDSLSVDGITLTHQSVAGVTGSGYAPAETRGTTGAIANGQILVQDQTLYTHSLGYPPQCQVRYDGMVVNPGMVVQDLTRRIRFVSVYATSSIIGIRNVGISNTDNLPSIDVDYDLTIFRQPAVQTGAPLMHLHLDGDEPLVMGHGRITSAQRPLRRTAPGDTGTFHYAISQAVDIWGGAVRFINLEDGVVDYGGAFGYFGSLVQASFVELTR